MLFELREYRIRDGRRDEWVRLMEETIIPFVVGRGVAVVGSFVGEAEDDLYVWIRRFDDEAHREQAYHDIYENPEWVERIRPRIDEMLVREEVRVTRLMPTPRSVTR